MKKNFLVFGFAVPDSELEDILANDRFPAIQTHRFNWNLIKSLETSDIFNFTYISARPVSDYPYFSRKKVKGNSWTVNICNKEISICEIPFLNFGLLKIISRFLSAFYYGLKRYKGIDNKGGVIVYSVHVPFMVAGYAISKIFNIDYIGVWTDMPSVRNSRESFLKSKLRTAEFLVSKFFMRQVSKVIVLTKYLAEDFAPGRPYLVIEGIIDEKDIPVNKPEKVDRKFTKVLYTGAVSRQYGINNIVEGFNLIKDEDMILEIYGCGDYEEELKHICSLNKRISFNGFVSNERVLEIQRGADFLINARSDADEYVKYSFPSKTLEYMLSGVPIITTMLPGIPKEYENYVIPLEDNRPETIYKKLKQIMHMPQQERAEIGRKAEQFARSKRYQDQGEKINNFLKN